MIPCSWLLCGTLKNPHTVRKSRGCSSRCCGLAFTFMLEKNCKPPWDYGDMCGTWLVYKNFIIIHYHSCHARHTRHFAAIVLQPSWCISSLIKLENLNKRKTDKYLANMADLLFLSRWCLWSLLQLYSSAPKPCAKNPWWCWPWVLQNTIQ